MSDENISSADDAGHGAAFRAPASTLTRWFARMFLPEDYPNSVSDDYAAFQAWDTAQGLSSYVRGSLTTKALLEGVGVGATGATAASAAAQFIARDMCGMVGGLVFTLAKGRHLDAEAKQWRLFADLANNVGMAMELAAPLANDRGWFLALACAGSVARSLCGCAAGATRAALTQHFARARNAADIAAKEGSQETAVTLVGMSLGMAVTTTTDGKTAWQWAVFVALTVAHVYCNVRAVRSLVIDSLNRERVVRLLARYDETLHEPSATSGFGKVSAENSPRGLAKDEALLPVGMNWMLWPWYRYRGAMEGVRCTSARRSLPRRAKRRSISSGDFATTTPIRLAPVIHLRGESTRWCPPKVRARAAARAWCCAWTPRRRISSRRTCTRRSCRARFQGETKVGCRMF